MLLFIYTVALISAMYWIFKNLVPEFSKPPIQSKNVKPIVYNHADTDEFLRRISRLEDLLIEKNKNITLLQSELKVFHVQLRDYDKIKSMLEEEVHRLREQNRIFRSELGLPKTQNQEVFII